jgi:hypothetical protein
MNSTVIFTILIYLSIQIFTILIYLSIQLCRPTKSSCEEKKATKTFPIFFKPPHSTDWYLYLLLSHPCNYCLPDLLTSSHFHPFVLHLKIVEFWWARSNHNIHIRRQIINSCHSAHVPMPIFYKFLFIYLSVDALEVMLWCASS